MVGDMGVMLGILMDIQEIIYIVIGGGEALAMGIIAAMIGVKGLGQPVLQSIYNQYFTKGVLYGLAIVIVAIVFDRVSQSYGKRIQKHRSGKLIDD